MKSIFTAIFSISILGLLSSQATSTGMNPTTMHIMSNGIGIGSAIAVVASWSRNKSVLWAIVHAIFGWFYVIYFALTGGADRN